jgi:hypothetical protein
MESMQEFEEHDGFRTREADLVGMTVHPTLVGADAADLSMLGKVSRVNAVVSSRTSRSVRTWPAVAVLSAWTAFLWITRIKNTLGNDDTTRGGKVIALVTSMLFLAAAVVVVLAHLRGLAVARRAAAAFAAVSIVYWLIRVATILGRDHPVGFKVVHAVLGLITVGLGLLVLRAATGRSARGPIA